MSIYTVVSLPKDVPGTKPAINYALENELVWEGLKAGIFDAVAPLNARCSVLVEINAHSESEARFLLDSLAYIKPDTGTIELATAA